LASVHSFNHRKGVLLLPNGKEVPVAVRKREEVRQELIQLMVNEQPENEANIAAEDQGSFAKP
jgi:hypothetical protein